MVTSGLRRAVVAALVGLVAAVGTAGAAAAQTRDPHPDLLAVGVGYFDVVHNDNSAAQFRAEWRSGDGLWNVVKPLIGLMGTTDGSYSGFAGILFDFQVGNFYITPSFAPGFYVRGDGKDLGGPVEFRSQIELGYKLPNRGRIAVSLDHMSNAGIYNENPGVETVMLTYGIPLDLIFYK